MRRRNSVTLATSHFMPTYGIHVTHGKTLAASSHANPFTLKKLNRYDKIEDHLKQVDNACAGAMGTFLPLLPRDGGAACHNAARSILQDVKRTQSYLINRKIALTVSRYLLTALRLNVKSLVLTQSFDGVVRCSQPLSGGTSTASYPHVFSFLLSH